MLVSSITQLSRKINRWRKVVAYFLARGGLRGQKMRRSAVSATRERFSTKNGRFGGFLKNVMKNAAGRVVKIGTISTCNLQSVAPLLCGFAPPVWKSPWKVWNSTPKTGGNPWFFHLFNRVFNMWKSFCPVYNLYNGELWKSYERLGSSPAAVWAGPAAKKVPAGAQKRRKTKDCLW